jgi:hypothetical protein
LFSSQSPTALSAQAIIDANINTTAMVMESVSRSATALGSRSSRARWSGQTMARMNKAKASGAKTELVKYRATDSRMTVQMTSDAGTNSLLVLALSLGGMRSSPPFQ